MCRNNKIKRQSENNGWQPNEIWVIVGNYQFYIFNIQSNIQERLWEMMEGEKYKKHPIYYWLNDVFWLTEVQECLLKKKVDLNEEVSIKELLEKIRDIWWYLACERMVNLADYSLVTEYMDKFLDYCDDNGCTHKMVSINYFLEMLSSFEKSMVKKGKSWLFLWTKGVS